MFKVWPASDKSAAAQRVFSVKEWIVFALTADSGFRAMAGIDHKIIFERENIIIDRCDQLIKIATGQIGSPDRTVK